ncbi:MAG TPA: UDP-N-acetylmuramyl-tripeptide synthetase [Polyangiaceae bacterium]|nr:UDP-N-acetylmuramyl-tripeptide synthetase [Polyangiaceae bacterium]
MSPGRGASKPFPPAPAWVKGLEHVGVTGTNGKTSTTRFSAAALGSIARPVASFTTVGAFLDDQPIQVTASYRGVLDAVRSALERGGRYAVLEVTSEVLSLGFARRWPFRAAVFTNLSHDHLDAHGSPEHYFASKAQLFNALPRQGGLAVVNGCDDVAELLLEVTPESARRLLYGVASRGTATLPLDASASACAVTLEGTRAAVTLGPALGGGSVELCTRAIGAIFLENALAAWLLAVGLGAEPRAALAAVAGAAPPRGRFEVLAREPTVVVDYAHTPDALRRTLDTARALGKARVVVVFGAGGNRDKDKRPAMGAAAGAADRVIITSDNPRDEDPKDIAAAILEAVPKTCLASVDLDRARAIRRAVTEAGNGDIVVIAGKGHELTQTIGGVEREFSDVAVARAALAERGGEPAGEIVP